MKTIHTFLLAGAFAAINALPAAALADGATDHSKMGEMKMAPAGAADMTDAEVRKVDMDQGKVTLKHGEIKNLDMPPMTMVFRVKDKAMLEGVKAGDKVRFKVVNADGKFMVTDIAPVK